jgi:polar amino acid transport system substrate-binding protein
VNGKADAMVAYVSNELYQLKARGLRYNIIHPKDYGFDMYSDILFTSGKTVKRRPDLVKKFYRASLRGWLYAFDHLKETASIIHKHYNTQNRTKEALIYEGEVLKGHAFDEYGGFGTIIVPRLKQMVQVYLLGDLLKNDLSMDGFVYQPTIDQFHLSSKELEYLSGKDRITMCVSKEWMPYEDYVDNKHIGMVSDYLGLIQRKIGIPFTAIPTDSVKQAREYLQSGECEIISNIVPTVWGGRFHSYSIPYLNIPLSIATMSGVADEKGIPDSIAVIEETAFEEIVRVRHPDIRVVSVENGMQGLDLIKDGTVKSMLCTGGHINNMMSEHNIRDIVVNDFNGEEVGISVAVAKENDLLLGLIDKAIRSITHKEREGITSGWINVKPKPTISPNLLWTILLGFGVVVVLAVYINLFMARHNKQLTKMAGTDWLTQMPNRHSTIHKMEEFLNHSNRYSRTVSLIYFDVDNFKLVNDRFGHNVGDEVLKKMANLISNEIRVTDACGRWGGEEFVLVSLETDINESKMIAEKLRKKIEEHDFGIPIKITCSFGVAQYESEEPLEYFVHRADLALYEAKSMGRNRVVVYGT